MNVAKHPDRRLVFYPCRANTIQNFNAIHPDHRKGVEEEDWTSSGSSTREDLLRTFPDAHPALKEIFRLAPENDIKRWPLIFRAPQETWHKGRCLLIGDAAHPMLPHQGQAGALALEDATALAVVLTFLQNDDITELKRRLELFEKVMIPRASAMQVFSSIPYDDEVEKVQDEVRPYLKGKIPTTVPELREWTYSFDVLKESIKQLRDSRGSEILV